MMSSQYSRLSGIHEFVFHLQWYLMGGLIRIDYMELWFQELFLPQPQAHYGLQGNSCGHFRCKF